MTGTAIALLAGLPSFAGDRVFVLVDHQLDAVTAGGISVVSEGFSAAAALGDQALSDSVTNAFVDPENGSADAFGFGVGTDGSQAVADTSATGQNDAGIATTNSIADGVSYDSQPTLVLSTSTLTLSGTQQEVTGSAVAQAPESFSSASTGVDVNVASNQVSSGAEGTSIDLNGSGSTTQVLTLVEGTGTRIQIQSGASAQGSLFSATDAGTVTSGDVGGIGIDTQSFASTGSTGSGASDVTTVIISDGSGVLVRTSGLATQTGEVLVDPTTQTAITLNGVPTTATVTGTSRTTLRSGVSRSLSIRMITR